MAVVVTVASGYDLGYIWKNQAGHTQPERSAGGYYINAAQAGEPPGRWFGPGAAALGFGNSQIVERGPYELVYQQTDPHTGTKLGRARGGYATFATHLAGLMAAEPHATAERLLELEREAAQATRQSPAYTDMTISFSKSISVFHASIRENERRARLASDHAAAAWWADAERRYQEVLQTANRAGLEYVQRWAGITRTGYHGRRVNGQEPGRFEEGKLVVTSWLQGTSRDGDPQDHVHNQIARMVRTTRDGKWRALDTMCLRGVIGAVQAIVATHAECGLTREFGVQWIPRTDGAGNEIAGISQQQMDACSSRTVSITAKMPEAVASWMAKYGRAPNRRELLYIRQEVTMTSRQGKDHGATDWDALSAKWDAQLGALVSIAPRVSNLRARAPSGAQEPRADAAAQQGAETAAQPRAESRARTDAAALPRDERTRAVQHALARVQAAHSTWTRAGLIKHLGLVLPPQTRTMAPEQAVALLDQLADEALSGQVEQVVCLEAPQWPPLPAALLRDLDGRSVYTRPGTTRYATRVQLGIEEQLLQDAQRQSAPHLHRGHAAALLGADAAALEAALLDHAGDSDAAAPSSGLRLDQAAALFHVLTSARTADVLTGPAGSGKTRVLAEAARAWTAARKGEVLGIATAQAARNVLAAAGVDAAENSAVFLGHLPDQRGARGIRDVAPGTLLVIDEASMMSLPDLAEIIGHAARSNAKVIVAGDHEQLAAVESGGGMTLLASRLGHVQLTEAVRFTAQWERDASLRLRAGDASALDEYHQHGRIRGAEPEQALDDAARRYIAYYLDGQDVLLIIADNERCREVSRRIRDDLIHLGLVDATGPEVILAHGARASAGDLITARQNDHTLQAGEPGRTLANGDTLRIDAIPGDGTILVRRALDCTPGTGARRWTRPFTYSDYGSSDLAYAVTGHAAQGRTVAVGIAVLTGNEDRQWLYVAMTRGRTSNVVIAFTQPGKPADLRAGTRPAPELDRHDRIQRERAALPAPSASAEPAARQPEPRAAIAVAADTISRDGSETSAILTRDQALADADHLAMLNAIWQDQTARLNEDRYWRIVHAGLPDEYSSGALSSPTLTWLYRTMRAAEAAGLDAQTVVRQAIDSRSLAGARDVAAVIDFRIRQVTDPLVSLSPRPWSERVPHTPDPALHQYLTDLAAAMDARKDRIGEHLAEHPPVWAERALGPLPAHPLDRLAWQRRAADIGAYRELYSYDHPDEPIGPEPAGDTPDKRAAWHAAFAALGPADDTDLRALPDGLLWQLRSTYEAETGWAPRHTGHELARIRASADDARLGAIRADAEERISRQRDQTAQAERHGTLARSFTAMETFYRQQEKELEQTMHARRAWEQATEPARLLAVAADAELRRRHPGQRIDPLCSAEPVISQEERDQLSITPGAASYRTPAWITHLAAERRAFRQRVAERTNDATASPDASAAHGLDRWPVWSRRIPDAILQAPKPEIQPSPSVAQRAAEQEAELW